jgi:hypothetical protein
MITKSLSTLALLITTGLVQAQSFSFGLWGDMPYAKAGDEPKMPAILNSINKAPIDFSIFVGDIKDGSSKCTDDVYTRAQTMFNSMVRPLVYIPGDNEWTDCHRLNNGGYDGLERLSHIRKVMFSSKLSYGQQKITLEDQSQTTGVYKENTRFLRQGVVFITLNIPGSNNNKVLNEKDCTQKSARTLAQCEQSNAEYTARDAANIQWLQSGFEAAKTAKARGIVLAFQGDPGFDLPETEDLDESKAASVSGYQAFLAQVVQATEKFDGQVLLVHGDTHFFKVDKPLYSPTRILPNLTRLQTFGSPNMHWVKVNVDPKRPGLFDIEPMMVQQP